MGGECANVIVPLGILFPEDEYSLGQPAGPVILGVDTLGSDTGSSECVTASDRIFMGINTGKERNSQLSSFLYNMETKKLQRTICINQHTSVINNN